MDSEHKANVISLIGVAIVIGVMTLVWVGIYNYSFTQQLETLSANGDDTSVQLLLANEQNDAAVLVKDAAEGR